MQSSRRQRIAFILLAAGLAMLYVPTFLRLAQDLWRSDDQAHGPLIFGISCWLLWRQRREFLAASAATVRWPALAIGCVAVAAGVAFYVVGRSQGIEYVELGSLLWLLTGSILVCFGARSLRVVWFPVFFMLFMLPLPGLLVAWFTMPMKIGVSYVAELLLHLAGYPVGRTGVILQVGQYQLLVADACAGLHTLLTLEALGLLYLNLTPHQAAARNVGLALLIVPISFSANVIRIMVLSLITYYFGDDAGQGFLHGFAGMVLFLSALALVLAFDSALRVAAGRGTSHRLAAAG